MSQRIALPVGLSVMVGITLLLGEARAQFCPSPLGTPMNPCSPTQTIIAGPVLQGTLAERYTNRGINSTYLEALPDGTVLAGSTLSGLGPSCNGRFCQPTIHEMDGGLPVEAFIQSSTLYGSEIRREIPSTPNPYGSTIRGREYYNPGLLQPMSRPIFQQKRPRTTNVIRGVLRRVLPFCHRCLDDTVS